MAKLASYAEGLDPAPVTGWWNTDRNQYNPPPPEPLIELTEAQWAERLAGPWAVAGGALVAYTPPPTPAQAIADRIAQGATIQPLGAVLSLTPGAVTALREVAVDVNAGFGLPNDAAVYPAQCVGGAVCDLTEAEVVAAYRGVRDLTAAIRSQGAAMEAGREPVWPEQTITL